MREIDDPVSKINSLGAPATSTVITGAPPNISIGTVM
jgi:hypothetical protein